MLARLLFFISISLFFSCADSQVTQPNLTIPFIEVTQQDVPLTTVFIGQLVGSKEVDIRARVEGTLEGIHFTGGTFVRKGDPLYTIDPSPFEAKVVEARSRVAEAKTLLAKAESDLRRIRPLAKIDAVSKRDLDAAIAQHGAAQAALEAASANLDFTKIQRGFTDITSPISGLIGLTLATEGGFVGRPPNPVILNTVAVIDPIGVKLSLTEQEYLRFARQMAEARKERGGSAQEEIGRPRPAELFLILSDNSRHPYPGKPTTLDAQVDPKTGTLQIEAEFPNPDMILRPGQFARVEVNAPIIRNALTIPARAIQDLQGQSQVFVINSSNIIEARTISLGGKTKDGSIVTSGLQAGEKVAVSGLQKLRPGITVVPVRSSGI